jgi:hypothetical protein
VITLKEIDHVLKQKDVNFLPTTTYGYISKGTTHR